MDFSGYYDATEEAFAAEKEEMLDRVDQLGSSWDEASRLDELSVQRCKELLALKKMLEKGHLQILRTKEEALQMVLKNSQLRFHIRQLQSEIFRLLPYSHSDVPSTEYHMSLEAQPVTKPPSKEFQVQMDQQHEKDLIAIRQQWSEICQLQAQVFAESVQHNSEDQAQWAKFEADFRRQNEETHRQIDTQLADITRRYVALKNSFDEQMKSYQEKITGLDNRQKHLKKESESTLSSLSEKSLAERSKARTDATQACNIVRERVRELEKKNLRHFSEMKTKDNALQQEELQLLRETDELSKRVKDLEKQKEGLANEGCERVAHLEAQLNAIISSVAAIKDVSPQENTRILRSAAAAVGKHAKTAASVEQIDQQIEAMSQRLQRVADLYAVM